LNGKVDVVRESWVEVGIDFSNNRIDEHGLKQFPILFNIFVFNEFLGTVCSLNGRTYEYTIGQPRESIHHLKNLGDLQLWQLVTSSYQSIFQGLDGSVDISTFGISDTDTHVTKTNILSSNLLV
jgi:hypothetical protein